MASRPGELSQSSENISDNTLNNVHEYHGGFSRCCWNNIKKTATLVKDVFMNVLRACKETICNIWKDFSSDAKNHKLRLICPFVAGGLVSVNLPLAIAFGITSFIAIEIYYAISASRNA